MRRRDLEEENEKLRRTNEKLLEALVGLIYPGEKLTVDEAIARGKAMQAAKKQKEADQPK